MKATRNRSSITLFTTIVIALLTGCHGSDDDDPAAAAKVLQQALAPREVRLITAEARQEHPSVDLVGEIRAFDTLAVSSEVAGKVDRVLVEVGDRVAAGTPLVEVDRKTFKIYEQQAEANLAAAKANLALADKELERKRDLRSDETIPQSAFDQALATQELATARVSSAVSALDLAQRDYDRSVVRAPAAGVITRRMVVAGQWAEVGVALLGLDIGDKVKIAARVPEAWARRLTGLETFTFTVGVSGAAHQARVYSVEPAVEEASRSFEVVGTAVNDGTMKPGMFANVTLTSPTVKTSLWLPALAIATSDLPQVLMVEDGAIVFRKIQIGRRVDSSIEVVAGLEPDEKVVADVSGLTRGLPVTVIE
jgi:membrane fusion protein (multidrug efflux system)